MDGQDTMPSASGRRVALLRRLGYTLLCGIAVAAFAGGWLAPTGRMSAPGEDDPPRDLIVNLPPVPASPARQAAASLLPPATRVIGVTVGGKHRAYVVSALTAVHRHVLTDTLGEVPVAVAYCDRTDCAAAYTAGQTEPLKVAVGGWTEADGMMVRVGDHRYTQLAGRPVSPDAPPFPYRVVTAEKTTWAEWRTAHPDTDVCGD